MRQIICNYRTDEELVSSPDSAFIAINFLNFRRSFITGKQPCFVCILGNGKEILAIATIVIIFYQPYLQNTKKNLQRLQLEGEETQEATGRMGEPPHVSHPSLQCKIRTKINGAVKFVYVKLQNVLLSKFLLLTYPFLSLIPCDWSQETASSVIHEFAAIIHYCVRRTRSKLD